MQNPYAANLESDIISATPVEIVRMLYGAALEAVCEARQFLAAGKIRERSAAVSRALEILVELNGALNADAGDLAVRLAALYDYMERRLIEANFQQTDAPLAETAALLQTLAEAWNGVSVESTEAAPEFSPCQPPGEDITSPWAAVPPESGYATSSWSL